MDSSEIVIDASAALELLLGRGPTGRRVQRAIGDAYVIAPTVFPYEVTNVIRRLLSARRLSPETAELAWIGLAELDVELWQWPTLSARVWQLRGSISSYDASYVALAELMACPLLTADARLARMAPATCQIKLIA